MIKMVYMHRYVSCNQPCHTIDPSQEAWLTGDLTNHFVQQIRHMWVDLNLKNGVYWRLSAVEIKNLLMFIRVYFHVNTLQRFVMTL